MSATSQLSLNLPEAPPRLDRASWVRAEANDAAWRTGEAWLKSAEPILVVCGPSGSGKTHLAHALLHGVDYAATTAKKIATTQMPFTLIDDMPADDPHGFLKALEDGAGASRRFILAGEGHPSLWAQGLKDLRTRLEAAPRAVLAEPDEALLRAVIAKGFRDRQVSVSPAVIDYVAPRLPRTFAAAHGFVALADKAALSEKRKITAPFVQKILDNLSEGGSAA